MKKFILIIPLALVLIVATMIRPQARYVSGSLTIDELVDENNDGILYLMTDDYINTQYIWYFMEYKTAVYGSNKVVLTVPDNAYINLMVYDIVVQTMYEVSFIELFGNRLDFISNNVVVASITKGSITNEYYLQYEPMLTFDDGVDYGYELGLDDGYDYGYDYGYDEGYNDGKQDGFNDGWDEGYDEGYDVGYDYGWDDASIIGYPENLAEWYSQSLYSDYYHMTTGNILLDTNRKGITVIVPDFDNVITSAGSGTEQRIVFYDAFDNELSSTSVYGRLVGRFDYSIPVGAYSFNYYVLVEGPLPSNYVYEWNKVAYVGYKDLLTTYSQAWQEGYDEGYDYGKDDGFNEGYHEGRDYGYELGKVETIDLYKDEWFEQGKSVGYAEGLDENISTGGFMMILSSAFLGVSTLLGIELLPNITLGMIVAVPLVFGLLFFILGKRKD